MNILNLIAIAFLICVAPHFEKFKISGGESIQETFSELAKIALNADSQKSEATDEKLF